MLVSERYIFIKLTLEGICIVLLYAFPSRVILVEKIFVIKVLVISYQTFHHTYNVNFQKNLYKNTLLYLL